MKNEAPDEMNTIFAIGAAIFIVPFLITFICRGIVVASEFLPPWLWMFQLPVIVCLGFYALFGGRSIYCLGYFLSIFVLLPVLTIILSQAVKSSEMPLIGLVLGCAITFSPVVLFVCTLAGAIIKDFLTRSKTV